MSSIFDAPTTEPADETTTSQEAHTTDDWVTEVVKEKGDQWSDPQVLAKGYAHAQARIKELEELAKKAEEQDYAKKLLEQIQAKQADEVTPSTPEPAPKSDTEQQDNTSLRPEDIESLLEKTLSKREKIAKVETALKEKFGDSANAAVHKAAKENGLSIERMQQLAEESPQAFLRLVGEPEAKQPNTTVKGAVSSTAGFNSGGQERTQSYYSKLRRENRKLYDNPKVQRQMFEDRLRLGQDFYK